MDIICPIWLLSRPIYLKWYTNQLVKNINNIKMFTFHEFQYIMFLY